ncbi:acyl-CoA thioesterase [Dokdonella sp.]|uniref:acyl-CoA thioesterase n=1 Tax=Dokdonella sp. TaxID=2291710 RepID=UPI001B27BB21|nr:acyl-CoA thioesterase [Dokdonella sp.]MBO9663294.1 acyl-CoA thioesterase [Dokdonella sp.]
MRSEAAAESGVEVRCVEIVFPDHCNHLGSLFGGQALAWMDKAAFLAASRFAGRTVVTARSDRIDFRAAVKLGDIVELRANVVGVGRSSMTVRVSLLREPTPGAERQLATSGEFVMVAVDEQGRAVPVGRALDAVR